MFNKILVWLGIKYDFNQWDKGKFPLGMYEQDGPLPLDWVRQVYDKDRDFVVSPNAARLLQGRNELVWPGDLKVDENLPSITWSGKYLKADALRLRRILRSRGAL